MCKQLLVNVQSREIKFESRVEIYHRIAICVFSQVETNLVRPDITKQEHLNGEILSEGENTKENEKIEIISRH